MSIVKRQKVGDGSLIHSKSATGQNVSSLVEGLVLDSNTGGSMLSGSFSSDGSLIATGGTDKLINLWTFPNEDNLSTNLSTISGHKSAITSLKWSEDDSLLFTSSADKTIGIWDTETGQRIRKLKGHELVANEICVFGKLQNQLLVSCGDDGRLLLWDPREKSYVKEFKTDYPLLTCTKNNASNTVYTSGIDPTVYSLDLTNFETPIWTAESHKDYVTSLSISPDDLTLVSRSNDGTLKSYNAQSFVENNASRLRPGIFDGSISSYDSVIRCGFYQNYLISGSDDKHLTVWDFNSRKLLKKIGGHIGSVLDIDVHPNLNVVLSTSTDGTCIIRTL